MNTVRMNALQLRAPRRLAALLALAALLTAAAFLALGGLGGAAQAALSADQRSAQLNLSLIDDSDNIVPAGSTMRIAATISFTVDASGDGHGPFGEPIYLQSGGRFRVTGGLTWDDSERAVLFLNARATSDEDASDAADDGKLGDPRICTTRTEGGTTTWTCTLAIQHGSTPLGDDVEPGTGGILIPDGTPDGPLTISATVKIDDAAGDGSDAGAVTLTDSLTVTVGKVVEVQTATLDFALQTLGALALNGNAGDPWPSVVSTAAGETRLQLSMLNAGGKASARNSVAQLSLTTTIGRLSVPTLGADACQTGDRQRVCQVDVSLLNSTNSDRILIRVEPPLDHSARTAIVRGNLLTTDGRLFELGPVRLRFTGPAIALNISEPAHDLLNSERADDDLDELTISVGATDARGDQVAVPRADRDAPFNATLTTPGNRSIPTRTVTLQYEERDLAGLPRSGQVRQYTFETIRVDWPLLQSGADGYRLARDSEGRLQAKVTVLAAAEQPLETGTYTLKLSAGGLEQSVKFAVVSRITSGVAAIAVAAGAEEIGLDDQLTLTATLTTAAGKPVRDGTSVTFTERSFGTNTVLVMLSPATQRTKDGQATVTLWAVAPGRAWVEVESGGFKGVQVLEVAAEPAIADVDQLLSTRPASFSVWLGATSVRVSGLLPQLEGVNSVRMWNGENWLLYGVVGGIQLPGSLDFVIGPGAILWLASE